jgi:hypothetical protein
MPTTELTTTEPTLIPTSVPATQPPEPAEEPTPTAIITTTEPVPVPSPKEQIARLRATKGPTKVAKGLSRASAPNATAAAAKPAVPVPAAPEPVATTPEAAIAAAIARGVGSTALVTAINKLKAKPAPAAKPPATGPITVDMTFRLLRPGPNVTDPVTKMISYGLAGRHRLKVYQRTHTVQEFLDLGAAEGVRGTGMTDLLWDKKEGLVEFFLPKPEASALACQ